MSFPFVLSLIVLLLTAALFKASLSGLLHPSNRRSTKTYVLPLACSIGMFVLTIEGLVAHSTYQDFKAAAWAIIDIASLVFMLHVIIVSTQVRKDDYENLHDNKH